MMTATLILILIAGHSISVCAEHALVSLHRREREINAHPFKEALSVLELETYLRAHQLIRLFCLLGVGYLTTSSIPAHWHPQHWIIAFALLVMLSFTAIDLPRITGMMMGVNIQRVLLPPTRWATFLLKPAIVPLLCAEHRLLKALADPVKPRP
jgi:CBS domain containing-hemolysin-like protein